MQKNQRNEANAPLVCNECKNAMEWPTGRIRGGRFTCSTCLDAAEMASHVQSAKYIFVGFGVVIVIGVFLRFV